MQGDRSPGRTAGVADTDADPRLVVVSREPFNAETALAENIGLLTPNALFYVRGHFPIPQLNAADWRLAVGGEVERPLELSYDDLRALPSRSLLVTLECAGNGRIGLQPQAEGEPWGYGAVSTAEWTGVPLAAVLELAGVRATARELVVEGADGGQVAAAGGAITYMRSMSVDVATHPDTLLAYAMNGEPLPAAHGFPLRLVVPGWYGMAAVKWVTRITAGAQPFEGFYQVDRYVMTHPERGETAKEPLAAMRVRSLVTWPDDGASLPVGQHTIRGLAWSGAAPIERVEVSVDGGATWQEAQFASAQERYAWRRWEYRWRADAPDAVTVRSRAFDAAGNTQPAEPEWNRLGYCNNAIQVVGVTIT